MTSSTLALFALTTPLAIAALLAAVAAVRDRDGRHLAPLALAALLAGATLVAPPPAPTSLEAALGGASTAFLLRLGAHLAALWAALLATRSVHERNRAEHVQWTSMEALRALSDQLRAASTGPAESALAEADRLIALGCERLGFEGGLLVARTGGALEILCARAPDDVPELAPGPRPELARTLVARCLDAADAVAVDRASDGHWTTHPEHAPFAWERFLGVRVLAAGGAAPARDVGEPARDAVALAFFDRAPAAERLGATEKSLLHVMASWLAERAASEQAAGELAARVARESDKPLAPAADAAPSPASRAALPDLPARPARESTSEGAREAAAPPAPDASGAEAAPPGPAASNAPPSRLPSDAPGASGAEVRADARPDVAEAGAPPAIELDRAADGLADELARAHAVAIARHAGARAARVAIEPGALERIAASLVAHAADVAPRGRRGAPALELFTGLVAALDDDAPAFATLAVRARGAALDADALAAIYESGTAAAPEAPRRLPLARVVRLLRAAGGDLSLESEEGVGTTFTAFLPVARPRGDGDARTSGREADARARASANGAGAGDASGGGAGAPDASGPDASGRDGERAPGAGPRAGAPRTDGALGA
ncbi:MAG: hypothetical protein R3E88_08990 [Myxococcota bacterium]